MKEEEERKELNTIPKNPLFLNYSNNFKRKEIILGK